jgi:hypothetical protein
MARHPACTAGDGRAAAPLVTRQTRAPDDLHISTFTIDICQTATLREQAQPGAVE